MSDREEIVDELYGARLAGRRLGPLGVALSIEAALELQMRVADRYELSGDGIAAWKIGMTSGSSRDRLGVGVRPFGFVTKSRVLESGTVLDADAIADCSIEPELCFTLTRALRGEVEPDEARDAVAAVSPAFEVNQFRAGNTDPGLLVADGLASWGIVVGREVALENLASAVTVEVRRGDEIVARATSGLDVEIDDHFVSLARLSAAVAEYGRILEAGQRIITGKFAGGFPIESAATWSASYECIGHVSMTFT
jgi:2-keto-4-pentenoate hydratase